MSWTSTGRRPVEAGRVVLKLPIPEMGLCKNWGPFFWVAVKELNVQLP